MFQWAVSLEITGACPAPGRFSSELSSLCCKCLWFPKMPGVSCNTFPQWQNGFQAQPHVSAANAPVQHFPSFRWLAGIRFPDGWRGPDRQWSYRRCTWTPQSAWQKNTSINQHEKRHLQNLTCQQSDFFWKSTINHDMVTVGTGCLLPLLFWPTHCNSSVLSLQVEVNSLMSFLRPFELSLDSRLFQYNVEIHPALNWVPCLFRHSAATLIEGFGHGKNYIDLIFTLLKNKYLISEKKTSKEPWSTEVNSAELSLLTTGSANKN